VRSAESYGDVTSEEHLSYGGFCSRRNYEKRSTDFLEKQVRHVSVRKSVAEFLGQVCLPGAWALNARKDEITICALLTREGSAICELGAVDETTEKLASFTTSNLPASIQIGDFKPGDHFNMSQATECLS
jgi:hypothetical protein